MIPTMEQLEHALAAKIQRLKDTHNHPDEYDVTWARDRMRLVTNFPKRLPPTGIKCSKNFQACQNAGRFAVQEK